MAIPKIRKGRGRSGNSVLAYMGVSPFYSVNVITAEDTDPTADDSIDLLLGTIWINTITVALPYTYRIWMLVQVIRNVATWHEMSLPEELLDFATDAGTATLVNDVLSLVGDGLINTTGVGGTVTFNFPRGDDGQVLIGVTGNAPVYSALTSPLGTIDIQVGPGVIELEVPGPGVLQWLDGDTGTAVADIAGSVLIAGSTNIVTTAAADTVTVALANNVSIGNTLRLSSLDSGVLQVDGAGLVRSDRGTNGQLIIGADIGEDAWGTLTSSDGSVVFGANANTLNIEIVGFPATGTAYLAGDIGIAQPNPTHDITIAGGSNISTTAGVNTVTVDLDDDVTLAATGSLTLEFVADGVVQTDAAGAVTSTKGTDGQLLISSTAGSPAWANITGGAGITVTDSGNGITISLT